MGMRMWRATRLRCARGRHAQVDPTSTPSIAGIVLWISEFGGYTGKSSGRPPGAITIRRGLDLIAPVAIALEQLEADGKMRPAPKRPNPPNRNRFIVLSVKNHHVTLF
jgi:hypothetical protein